MIFVIDDDEIMAEAIALNCKKKAQIFSNAIMAMTAINEGLVPDLIFLDILLDGPDGFTFLNELVSYSDTAKIPVVIISSLDFSGRDLSEYGVVGILEKEKMLPSEIYEYAERYSK
ncbi:response regulator [Candidatus Saccharibacteria bacterium]|nr:response regulator [Candidatus Saccharibacteria bacterium]